MHLPNTQKHTQATQSITNTHMDDGAHLNTGLGPESESGNCHKHNYSLLVFDLSSVFLLSVYVLCVCDREREDDRERMYVNICVTTYNEADKGEHLSHQDMISSTAWCRNKRPLNSM